MGWMVHHATIVTTWDEAALARAHAEAVRLGQTVTPLVESPVNGEGSFLIAPDGSKEGWSDSAAGNTARAQFRAWVKQQEYEDGSSALQVVEVAYGELDAPVITAYQGNRLAEAGDDTEEDTP